MDSVTWMRQAPKTYNISALCGYQKNFPEWWVIGSDGERVSAGLDDDKDSYDDDDENDDDDIKEFC